MAAPGVETSLPTLVQSLQGHDLSFLRIVADLWGVEFSAPDTRAGLRRLPPLLLSRERVEEVIELLPDEAHRALKDLMLNEGRLPWSLFTRRYGNVREMGPGRRDRERPYLNSASPAETLWYRALVGRAFFDTPTGPQEFAYIPGDLIEQMPDSGQELEQTLGRPATQAERLHPLPASDRLLDHACTYLAALRTGFAPEVIARYAEAWETSSPFLLTPTVLHALLEPAGLLDEHIQPRPEPVREFLEAGRGEALRRLVSAWLHSTTFDELRLIPGLKAEGEWQNDPLRARQLILDFISSVPAGGWWSLSAFVAAIRQAYPDYQRPAGDYDSWFIKDEASGDFLRGFEHWDRVDGALVRYLIGGPLHWLGLVDLATAEPGGSPTAFRLSEWSLALLHGQAPEGLPKEERTILAGSDARLRAPRLSPRAARYQVARFAEWEGENEQEYRYRITPASLESARQQGLRVSHLVGLLRRSADTLPPNLSKALERWEERGSEARLERITLLRLSSPELLAALRSSRAGRFLGDPVGPTSVVVNPGAWRKVLAALAEMGYLGEVKGLEEEETP